MLGRLRFWTRARDLAIVAVAAAALVAVYSLWSRGREPGPITLRVTVGRSGSERMRLLHALAGECRARRITFQVVETLGSEDALLKLASPKPGFDLALVQGGLEVEAEHHDRLRQVMALQDEAVHLLVRDDELARRVEADGLAVLRGRRISVGAAGSGTARLAREVLAFAGVGPGQYEEVMRDAFEIVDGSEAELPDAVFEVAMLPARSATRLIDERGYRLVPMPFDDAFMLWRPPPTVRTGVIHRFVRTITIPALAYDREPPVPDRALTTLSTRTLLIARADLASDVVERLLAAVLDSPFARYDEPPLDMSRLSETPEIPWHEGAVAYRNRNRPLIAEDLLDVVEKEFSVAGALLGAGFVLWQWIQKRIHRLRDEGFERYIRKVAEIERVALELEASPEMSLSRLFHLQRQLAHLKTEAIEKLVSTDAEDVQLMNGFLTQVNDARQSLTRLILHQREILEEQARQEGRPVQAVWSEAARHREPEPAPAAQPDLPGAGPP
jgi:TRAP-type uncharacterized transport system substrate-binding protein